MKIGIKIKLALTLSLNMAIVVGFLGFIMIDQQRSALETQMRSMALSITGQFARDSKAPLLQGDKLSMGLNVQNILEYPGIEDALILNENLDVQCCKKGESKQNIVVDSWKTASTPPWLIKEDMNTLSFLSPVVFQKTTVGYVNIKFSKRFINEKISEAITRVSIISISLISFLALLTLPFAARLLKPLFGIHRATSEIAMGNLGHRLPDSRKDEIGELQRSFNNMAIKLEQKEVLKGALNRYVSKDIADEILNNPDNIHLGGEKKDVTVFFSDIRGFTAFSQQMEPEEVVELLNHYFSLLTEAIFHFGGSVDKFIGDAVMAVFGSPVKDENHMEQGIKAAVAIRELLDRANSLREKKGLSALPMGAGFDSGMAIAGNMGSSVRMEYTVIGDTVNLAARLSGVAKGGEIILDKKVFDKISEHAIGELCPEVSIKGIDKPLSLYKLSSLKGSWKDDVDTYVAKTIVTMEKEHFGL